MKKHEINMLEGSLWDKLLLFALPVAASGLLQQLFNSADLAVVGHFAGSLALAAVGANSQVINLLINLFVGLSLGCNIVLANLLGKGDLKRANRAVHTTVSLAFLSGLFLAVLGNLLARPILTAISTPPEVLDLGVLYLRIYFAGMPFIMLFNFCTSVMNAKGDTRRPLIVLTCSGILNVLLNLVFVLRLHMTVDGVALATVISNVASSLALVFLLTKEELPFRLIPKQLGIDPKLLRWIAAVGIPSGIQSVMFSFSNVMLQSAINSLGSSAVAAVAVALNLEYLPSFVLRGFAQAATAFSAQNLGAGNIGRCKKVTKTALLLGNALVMAMSILIICFNRPFASIFTSDGSLFGLVDVRLKILLSFMFLNLSTEVLAGSVRGLGRSLDLTMLYIIGICGTRIVWIFTVFRMYPSFATIAWVYPVSWIINCTMVTVMYLREIRSLERKFS